jgi:predicted peroxiredoxin
MKKILNFVSAVAAVFALSGAAQAQDWSGQVVKALKEDTTSAPQSIMVSLKQDPATEDGFEAACISLQLSMLMMSKGADVTYFVSLGGARIADQAFLERDQRMCKTTSGEAPLLGLVNNFVNMGGGVDRIMVCPLCWMHRYGSEAEAMENMVVGAFIGTATTMGEAFLNAEKILDF